MDRMPARVPSSGGGGTPGVHHPRPELFWPVDAPELAERLLRAGAAVGSLLSIGGTDSGGSMATEKKSSQPWESICDVPRCLGPWRSEPKLDQ